MARLIALSSIVLLLAGVVAAWRGLDASIVNVTVLGDLDSAERQQVEETLRRNLRGGLLGADLALISNALNNLSWPRRVSVRRVWPDGLVLSLEKALVVAGWGDDYLTIDGDVVQLAGQHEELVNFDCQHTSPIAALELYQRLQRDVSAADLKIAQLKENDLGEWTLTFSNDIDLNIGASELDERVQRFTTVYLSELSDQVAEVAMVDARYANGVAVSWRNAPGERGVTDRLVQNPETRLEMSVAGHHASRKYGVR
jgi:cell division protein FtsQ